MFAVTPLDTFRFMRPFPSGSMTMSPAASRPFRGLQCWHNFHVTSSLRQTLVKPFGGSPLVSLAFSTLLLFWRGQSMAVVRDW